MAQNARKKQNKRPLSRGMETGAPAAGPPIPDPLGDDQHVSPSGRLTSRARDHEGLLRSGATPLPDGGIDEHPMHDHGHDDDLGPDEYEARFAQAPATGFEPREEDTEPGEETPDTTEVRRRRSAG